MWLYVALITSVFGAVAVIVDKKLVHGVSATLLTWCTLVFSTPLIFLLRRKRRNPLSHTLFFIGIGGSVALYVFARIIGFKAMRMADLSALYPLASLGPLFTLLVATSPPLSEKPSPLAIIGMFITLGGAYVLNIGSVKEGLLQPVRILVQSRASRLMIVSVLLESVVIIFDKIAINNTLPQNTTFTLLAENILVIAGLLPVLVIRDRGFIHQITINWKLFLLLGFLNAVATILAFSAVGGGDVGLVATVLKMQLLAVLLISFFVFKDKPKLETIIGSVVMILGVILIKIGS